MTDLATRIETEPPSRALDAEIAAIQARKYECFIEDHEPKPWTPGTCAGYAGRTLHLMRCTRRSGHGVGGLFCRQHAQARAAAAVRAMNYPHGGNETPG